MHTMLFILHLRGICLSSIFAAATLQKKAQTPSQFRATVLDEFLPGCLKPSDLELTLESSPPWSVIN